MIKLIEKIIKDKLSDGSHFDFVKYSTPLSGDGFGGKVLFFIFVDGQKNPSFIVKTVRRYEESFVIKEGFNNLSNLNKLVSDTKYSRMFPRALYIYDDKKEFIFSIESACIGTKTTNENKILNKYIDFQKSISSAEILASYNTYGESLISKFNLSGDDKDILMQYLKSIASDKNRNLIKVEQHGDLTLDNIVTNKNNIHIIDCDLFGNISLAGYDVYRFFRHDKKSALLSHLNDYFDRLGINMIADRDILFLYYLHGLLFKKDYIFKGKTGEDIISEFKKIHLC